MEELNRLIKEMNEKNGKVESRIPIGFEKTCECKFIIPDFISGTFKMIDNGLLRIKKFLKIDRYFCPKCGIELNRR